MKVPNFLEWINHRIEIEEAARHAYARDIAAPADPKQGDIVITNAKGFMKTLITPARGKLKNGGKSTIGKQGVSKATIAGFKDGNPVVRSTSFDARPKMIDVEDLLDVTPAFDDGGGMLSQLDTRQGVFIYNPQRSKNYTSQADVKTMWEKWWQQVARPQNDAESQQVANIQGNVFGNTDAVKQGQRDLGDSERKRNAEEIVYVIRSFKEGKPTGGLTYANLLQIMKGMVEDPYEVKWLRRNGFGDIPDTLHDIQMSASVAGEESGPPAQNTAQLPEPEMSQGGLDDLFNNPQPEAGTIATDPNALKARGQAVGGHQPAAGQDDEDEFWQRIRNQQVQRAWYDPWKRHGDKKIYAYYD